MKRSPTREMVEAMIRHLYVHIPFCPKVCPYCSFYKETSDRNKTQRFLEAVLAEASLRREGTVPSTICFGGGTPTALSTSQLAFLIEGLRDRLDFREVREFTLEMNPATVSLEKAEALRELGVNRVSMGVQSWDPTLLKTLGRVHSADQARRSFDILREAGFDNINLDLIFGIPGQALRQWEDTLLQTLELRPEHIACYCLTYEEDTEYFERFSRGEYTTDVESDAAFFECAFAALSAAGYEGYEISNYAKPGRRCLHNLAYWQAQDYLGLGPSAFSTCGEQRWRNIANTAEYIRRIEQRFPAADFEEAVNPFVRNTERIAFSLRTSDGVLPEWLEHPEKLDTLAGAGLLEQSGRTWLLTPKGRLVADGIAEELLA